MALAMQARFLPLSEQWRKLGHELKRGIGIARADQERVFERFFRSDPARSRNTGGTGLGLAIVKSILELHGSNVAVDSQPGHGASFYFELPIVTQPPRTAPT